MGNFASGQSIRLTRKLEASDTQLYGNVDVGVDSGRFYSRNDSQFEWINFTSVTPSGNEFIYGGLTRGLSQTADPITAGTGKTWLATQEMILVIMHDQLIDKNQPTQNLQVARDYATEAARDLALGGNGVALYNYVDIKVTSTGLFYNYNLSTGQWEVQGTGTATPNASTTVAGSVEIGTQTEVDTPTDTGGTGATNVVIPSTFQQGITNRIATQLEAEAGSNNTKIMTPLRGLQLINEFLYPFGSGSDGDVTITTTVTLSRDMYYNNLIINSPGILDPNGFKIFIKGTLSGNGIIRRNGNNAVASTGGIALNQGSLKADIAGGNGNIGTNNGINANPSYTTINGVSGGNGGLSAAGTPGTATRGGLYNTVGADILSLILSYPASNDIASLVSVPYKGPASSSGGGGDTGGSNGYGGGAGGNGGVIWIAANTLNFTGTIESKGGNGANGQNAISFSYAGGGGGGGGNGGVIYLIAKTITSIGTTTLTGGTGGAGGLGSSGPNGFPGATGNSGVVIQILV